MGKGKNRVGAEERLNSLGFVAAREQPLSRKLKAEGKTGGSFPFSMGHN